MGDHDRNSDSEALIKEKNLYERYKKQKLQISTKFMKMMFRIGIILPIFLILVSTFINFLYLMEILGFIVLSALSFTLQILNESSRKTYILRCIFILICECRFIYLGFSKYPQYIGIFAAMSYFFMWHGYLELIYSKIQGYITIIIHTFIWGFLIVSSDMAHTRKLLEISFILTLFLSLQIVWYWYSVSRDYQEIRINIELENKQCNVQNLLNAIPEGILVLDKDLKIIMKNKASEKLLKENNILYLKLHEKYNNKEKNTSIELEKYVKEFKESSEKSTTFGMCNSGCYSIECTGSKAEWNNSQCIILTLREVSCIIKLEDDLLLNSQTLKILQGVSHELKTPLNQIINEHNEILRSNQDISNEVQKHISKSLHLSIYLLSSIQDMIDYSHIKFKSLKLNDTWILTNEVILETIRVLKSMNSSCIIKVCSDISERLSIYTDKRRFKQCLLSLASISLG